MLEKEFAERYRTSQENVHAPIELVETAHALVDRARAREDANAERASRNATSPERLRGSGTRRVHPRKHEPKRNSRRPRWMMPVAACLAALLVLFGIGSTVLPAILPFMEEQAPVRAYAKTPNLLTAERKDGIIPFALDDFASPQGAMFSFPEPYSGIMFTIEGDDIARAQVTFDRGELYQMTSENLTRSKVEDADKLTEALNWKYSKRGMGTYLKEYDLVSVIPVEDGLDYADEDKTFEVRMAKRLGSTTDLPYEGEALTLGLWIDDMTYTEELSADGQTLWHPYLHGFDGAKITLTAACTSGAHRTQTIELHDGWFSLLPASDQDQGADWVTAAGPFDTEPYGTEETRYTFYGEVVDSTDQPHPFSLDGARERASSPAEPYPLEEEIEPLSNVVVKGAPRNDQIVSSGSTLTPSGAGLPFEVREIAQHLRWSDISAYMTDTLPANIDLCTDVYESESQAQFLNDLEYSNRRVVAGGGCSVNADGTIGEGGSFLVVNATIANTTDEALTYKDHYLSALTGSPCAIDRETSSILLPAHGSAFVITDDRGSCWNTDEPSIGPRESVRLQIVFIIDDEIGAADEWLYSPDDLYRDPSVGSQVSGRVFDFDPYQFVFLGKPERR